MLAKTNKIKDIKPMIIFYLSERSRVNF